LNSQPIITSRHFLRWTTTLSGPESSSSREQDGGLVVICIGQNRHQGLDTSECTHRAWTARNVMVLSDIDRPQLVDDYQFGSGHRSPKITLPHIPPLDRKSVRIDHATPALHPTTRDHYSVRIVGGGMALRSADASTHEWHRLCCY
jgi:hypothetical protein